MYYCTSLSAFCSTWCPTNTILRIAICRTTSEEKWKIYMCDKESNIYFNGWNISVGLVAWINWERTVVFIQSCFTPTGKKTLWVAPSPSEIYLFQSPLPLRISVTLHGGYRYFLEPNCDGGDPLLPGTSTAFFHLERRASVVAGHNYNCGEKSLEHLRNLTNYLCFTAEVWKKALPSS